MDRWIDDSSVSERMEGSRMENGEVGWSLGAEAGRGMRSSTKAGKERRSSKRGRAVRRGLLNDVITD